MCVYIYIYIYTHIYVYVYVYVYIGRRRCASRLCSAAGAATQQSEKVP